MKFRNHAFDYSLISKTLVAVLFGFGIAVAQSTTTVTVSLPISVVNPTYAYTIHNNTPYNVIGFVLGYDSATKSPELNVPPTGWAADQDGTDSGLVASPSGWSVLVISPEESESIWIRWTTATQVVAAGQSLSGFAVSVSTASNRYKIAHFDLKLSDGSHVSGTVDSDSVRIPGDINIDGKIDCTDIAMVRNVFGTRAGEGKFDPFADVNQDGRIDVRDLAFVSQRLPAGSRCQ